MCAVVSRVNFRAGDDGNLSGSPAHQKPCGAAATREASRAALFASGHTEGINLLMKTRTPHARAPRRLPTIFTRALLLLSLLAGATPAAFAQSKPAHAPSDVVREFNRAMREKRFREAFGMTIYAPAVESLSASEFEELRPDFEEMAAEFPDKVDINGEQISGDNATVFIKVVEGGSDKLKPTELIRAGDRWIIGGRSDQALVKQRGKQFFFEARVEAHHSLVEDIMKRITAAQLVYSTQHNGQYGDLPSLVSTGGVPQDVLTPDVTGYNFRIALAKNGKGYAVSAEPVRYGRTGRLSFLMDAKGLRSKDTGGKPLK